MSTIENRKINTLRKRLALCCLIIFFICVWSKSKYDDAQYFQEDNMLLMIELTEKEYEIEKLNHKLQEISNQNQIVKKITPKKLINKEKREKLTETDTLKSVIIIENDSLNVIR